MNLQEIETLIKVYEEKLEALQPTLNPGKSLSFTKVGLLNTARRKAKKYENNLIVLKMVRKNPSFPDETLDRLLQ